MEKIRKLICDITPLYRYNVARGLDESLKRVQTDYPELVINKYASGSEVWDWVVPQKWDLKSAYLKCDDNTLFSHVDHPIRVWSGSWPTNRKLSFKELEPHLFYSEDTPDLLPWSYKYYFHNKGYFGFSLTKKEFESLDQDAEYELDIDAIFYDDFLTMGTIFLEGTSKKTIIISSCICHPGQANDSLSGLAAALMLYERLKTEDNRYYSYLFTFQPEMIGTMAYLSQNPEMLSNLQYGIFSEMLGLPGKMILQHSLSKNTRIDAVAVNAMLDKYQGDIECKDFLDNCIVNDELILNHVGINVPAIAFNRGTYYEYHTSGDNFDNLNFDLILDASELMFDVVNRMDQKKYNTTSYERIPPRISFANRYEKNLCNESVPNFLPVPFFTGPIFLSKHGLYVDWQDDPDLNRIIEKIMISINGVNTCYDIAKYCGVKAKVVSDYLKKFEEKGLIRSEEVKV